MVTRPVAADWLAYRRAADHQARRHTAEVVDDVGSWLQCAVQREAHGAHHSAVVIDLGAGTGSNQAWLAPRLPVQQEWILLDHDPDLLELGTLTDTPQVLGTERIVGSVDRLPELVPNQAPSLVTCAALLDLLSPQEATLIAQTIAEANAAAILSLTVTGRVWFSPSDPLDETITSLFNAHQRREGLLGPHGADFVAEQLGGLGANVRTVATDWQLDSSQPDFLQRYLSDRVEAAVEYAPTLARDAHQWLHRRSEQIQQGVLHVTVGHQDLICLPHCAHDHHAE